MILLLLEFMNPGGSVKDRAALFLVQDAERRGALQPGGIVVEGTAGNTGIGLAHVCRASGYRCVIFMPNTQSSEKIAILEQLGADVRLVPVAPFDSPEHYNNKAKDFAKMTKNSVWMNQFDNTANRQSHFETTGPEIWNQLDGEVHAFTCGTGTGGTFAGVAALLKERSNNRTKCIIADLPGSVLFDYVKSGGHRMQRTGDSSITEGIGNGRITANMSEVLKLADDAVHIPDSQSVEMIYRMLDEEGLFLGASTCLNLVAAVETAKIIGPGHNIVTILCDNAQKYQSRLFNQKWLTEKGLWSSVPLKLQKYAVTGRLNE